MKLRVKLIFVSVLIFTPFTANAEVPDSIYYNRLYHVCKVWGFVKYFHTEIANGSVNWDDELLNAISSIKNAPDTASFNDSLLLMLNKAGVMGTSSEPMPDTPDSLNNIRDYSWMQNAVFSDSVIAKLDTIRTRFRPQSNVLVGEAWAGGNPVFETDDLYFSGENYPSEELRILALYRYWNIINYFYPYKYLMDQDWDTTLMECIPEIVGASDAVSYNLAFKRFSAKINDSHSYFYSPVYSNWLGSSTPPFLVRFIENETVITKVLPSISELAPGDIIKEIDGENIYHLRDSLRKFAHGSNAVIIERELNNIIMRGASGSFSLTINDGSNTQTVTLNRNSTNNELLNTNTSPIWKDTLVNGSCNFGIVDMGRLESSHISTMFNELRNTDAIIFDIRNYPNGTLWQIVNYIYPSSIHIANLTVPDITYPGRLYWNQEHIGRGTTNPYSGELIILFDERTQSQAEYTCMGLEQFPGAIKIGSTTSAADGNTTVINLPGNINTYATFLGIYYPDYTPTQRIGIIPDFEVHPTISGIREGRDEVMEFALNCVVDGIEEIEDAGNLTLYPNPARDEISYYLADENSFLLELFDLQGRRLKTMAISSQTGSINLSSLKSGTYIVKAYTNYSSESRLITKQ